MVTGMQISGMNKTQSTSSLNTTTEKNNKADKPVKQAVSKKNIHQKELLDKTSENISSRSVKINMEKKLRLKLKTFTTKNLLNDNSNPTQEEHNPISFDPKIKTDSKTITAELLMHWTGKDADYLEKNKKTITNLNSSAMLAFSTLLKEGAKLTTTPLPNCLISSKTRDSKFEGNVQQLLKDVIKSNPELESKIKNSPGLFKTPILISHKIKSKVQVPDDIEDIQIQEEQISSGIEYYPQIDTKNTASNSVTTLYLPDIKNKNRDKLIQGLEKALNKAVDRAEDLIPIESKITAKNCLMS
jgi:hypothetical protein